MDRLAKFRKFVGTDTILIFFIILGVTILPELVVLLIGEVGSVPMNLPDLIRQRSTAALVVVLAVLSYRFAVESEIRNSVNELEPMEVGDYRIVPVLYEVKWRPQIISSLFGLFYEPDTTEGWRESLRDWTQRRTALIFKIYSTPSGDKLPANAEEIFDNQTDLDYLTTVQSIYPEDQSPAGGKFGHADYINQHMRELSGDLAAQPRIHEDGIHITYTSLDERDVQDLADRTLRALRDELVK